MAFIIASFYIFSGEVIFEAIEGSKMIIICSIFLRGVIEFYLGLKEFNSVHSPIQKSHYLCTMNFQENLYQSQGPTIYYDPFSTDEIL